jgi:hypothetical protein
VMRARIISSGASFISSDQGNMGNMDDMVIWTSVLESLSTITLKKLKENPRPQGSQDPLGS